MRNFGRRAVTWALAGLLLGVWNDRLAVWGENDPQPIHVFDFRVSSLPAADQILLRRGIQAADSRELMALIEDFL